MLEAVLQSGFIETRKANFALYILMLTVLAVEGGDFFGGWLLASQSDVLEASDGFWQSD